MKRFWILWAFLACFSHLYSQAPLDAVECSLITCSPGGEVYQLYGHTAIRCRNFTRGVDCVFNYGVFTFEQPHFVWRFVQGKCDYMVQGIDWKYFPEDYISRGSSITSQTLNLTPEEANRLFFNLVVNCRPTNCQYRYNFLYNNCTTQVLSQIEAAINGTLEYPENWEQRTYRQIIHEYTVLSPWAREGNDFMLGADVDTMLTLRASLFAPENLMRYAAKAQIRDSKGNLRPLVAETEELVHPGKVDNTPGFPVPPFLFFLAFLIACILVVCLERVTGRQFWLWDVLLMSVQGIVGTLLLFTFLFSEHPAVDSNWLVCIFNPLPLVGLPFVVKAALGHRRTYWHGINFAIISLFLVFLAWIPQNFGEIIVPLALALLTRPISYHLYYRYNKTRQPKTKKRKKK